MDERIEEARMEAWAEVQRELAAQRYVVPHINGVLEYLHGMSFPQEGLLLGVPEGFPNLDEYPVALKSMRDTHAVPLLIVGDRGCGKRNFLQKIVKMADLTHKTGSIGYCVITSDHQEWRILYDEVDNFSAYSYNERAVEDVILKISGTVHEGTKKTVLLVIDDLSAMDCLEQEARSNLAYILSRGAGRGVCTIAAVDTDKVNDWTSLFRSTIVGRTQRLDDLRGFVQAKELWGMCQSRGFVMREDGHWLKFYAPKFQ